MPPGVDAPTPRAQTDVESLLDRAGTALGGQRRDGQHEMARRVAIALDTGDHLLVQAGTGTGKSLGYLVPAVRHAVLADERVIVSTATLALQRQVMTRDLPLVSAAVAPQLPRAPQIALLKGWHNYVCLHKVAGGYPQDEPGATLFEAVGEPPGAAEHPADGGGSRAAGDLGRGVHAQVLVDQARKARAIDEIGAALAGGADGQAGRPVGTILLRKGRGQGKGGGCRDGGDGQETHRNPPRFGPVPQGSGTRAAG